MFTVAIYASMSYAVLIDMQQEMYHIFFKLKKLQMKHIFHKVTLVIRQCKTKEKQIRVKDILNDTERQLLVNLDEGFYIFKTLRHSSAYFDRKKKDAFAMIRQLGFAVLFVPQSAAETRWPELLLALGKNVDRKIYSDEEIKTMTRENKDSATLVRYYDNLYLQFFNLVVKSSHIPIHQVTDYFPRYECAEQGTIHIHWFAYWKMQQSVVRQIMTQLPGFMIISSHVHQLFQRHRSSTYSIRFIDIQGHVT